MKIARYEFPTGRLGGLDTNALVRLNRFSSQTDLLTSELFPGTLRPNPSLTAFVLEIEEPTSKQSIEDLIQSSGLRHARIQEFLAFSSAFPDLQREAPLVALDSLGKRGGFPPTVLMLWGDHRTRYANWALPLHSWSTGYRFVAVSQG